MCQLNLYIVKNVSWEMNKVKLNSLRAKSLAGFLPLFIGSFVVFFAISYYMSSQALFKNADQISQEIGKSTALQIENNYQKKEIVQLEQELKQNK